LAAGYLHSLALDSTGKLFGWGTGEGGQLGLGEDAGVHLTPQHVDGFPEGTKIKKIAAGERFSMALSTDGQLYTFGSDGTGHKTPDDVDQVWLPRLLDLGDAVTNSSIVDIKHIDGGSSHGCLLVEVEQ